MPSSEGLRLFQAKSLIGLEIVFGLKVSITSDRRPPGSLPAIQAALPGAGHPGQGRLPPARWQGRRKGERNGAYRTGPYTAEAIAERRQVRMLIRGLRHLIDSSE